jgi:hypothetical protein
MKYTIDGKEYTEFDINLRCAELLGIKVEYPMFNEVPYHRWFDSNGINLKVLDLCNNPSDTDAIIDKCWDELIFADYRRNVTWEMLMEKHNCTKLVAACICYIEINEAAL